MQACPDIDELDQFAADEMDPPGRTRLIDHVGSCPSCAQSLGGVRENLRAAKLVHAALSRAVTALPERIGPFRIVRELGRGGMGVVLLAEQDHPRRAVALKLLRTTLHGADAAARFRREALALGFMDHPGIARVYEAGTLDAGSGFVGGVQPYLAMEFVDGPRIDAFVRECRPDIRQRLLLLARVADAVHHAHLRGVVHRDLKPGNILVSLSDAPGTRETTAGIGSAQPKVLDFGVARFSQPDDAPRSLTTQPGQLVGTLPYMSPEQLAGDPSQIDARSDVYALGVIAYELLSGTLPFDLSRHALAELAHILRDTPVPRLGHLDRRFRGDIERIVATAMAREPCDRYASAAEFAADIRRFLSDQPILARPPSLTYQLGKLARRHRSLVATVLVSTAALFGITAFALAQAGLAQRQRDAAMRRLEFARETVDYLLSGIGPRLSHVLGGAPIQRDLHQAAASYYARLAEEQPNDPGYARGVWRSMGCMAQWAARDGDHEQAARLRREVHARIEAEIAQNPVSADIRMDFGRSLWALAQTAQHEARYHEAEQLLRDSIVVFETLAADGSSPPPGDPFAFENGLADSHRVMSRLLSRTRQFDAAMRHLDSAGAIYERLAARCDDPLFKPRYLQNVAWVRVNRAVVLDRCGRLEDAAVEAAAASELMSSLERDQPHDPKLLQLATGVYRHLARLAAARGDEQAAQQYTAAASQRAARLAPIPDLAAGVDEVP